MINPKVPLFIPYGYKGIGKTMLLQRLTYYLRQKGYAVIPNGKYLSILDHKGMLVCYCIDMIGNSQLNINNPHSALSQEMHDIAKLPNRKIWGFMVENNNWLNLLQRQGYVRNIRNIAYLTPKDKVIFIYNKVDLIPLVVNYSEINYKGLFDSAESAFPNIFAPFERKNTLLRILKGKYSFKMVPFQTGVFNETGGSTNFVMGRDEYPRLLWNEILKYIR